MMDGGAREDNTSKQAKVNTGQQSQLARPSKYIFFCLIAAQKHQTYCCWDVLSRRNFQVPVTQV